MLALQKFLNITCILVATSVILHSLECIRKVKADETMGLVPNPKCMTINTKSPKCFLMLKLLYTNSGGKAIYNQLHSLSYWDGWAKLALQSPI